VLPRPPIQVLPPSAAERIAAGEVVERPASVVKELVENSLDAGARRVTIEIEGAGRRMIRVIDDGDGIPAAELPLAFERFATSKIRLASDLARIRTYGFRGEALPSIAAVSRVEVVTRPRGEEVGARIVVTGSSPGAVVPASGADGTRVTVEDLFFNTPARKGFLKSDAREAAVIIETVEAIALAAPDVTFRLVDSGREVLWAPAESFAARARRILGSSLAPHTLDLETAEEGAEIQGVLGTPQIAEPRRTHEWFLVNGRPVRSPLLARALTQAYHTLIPDDRHPVAILSVRVAPEEVDVNIHPRKTEVRFVREAAVFGAVVRAVRGVLRQTPLVHVVQGTGTASGEDAGTSPSAPARGVPFAPEVPPWAAEPSDSARAAAPPLPSALWGAAEPEEAWPEIRLIGQLALTYLVGESGGDLVLIDQHAAHERVLFEQLIDRGDAGGVRAQGLVTPVVLEISRAEEALLAEVESGLRALGFEVEPFGRGVVRLSAVPAIAAHRAPGELFRACLRDLGAETSPHAGRDLEERLAIATACHTAVRAGDRLDAQMMARLLEDLARARDPFSCFHGRPTIVRVRGRDLERWFYRRT
jgi:DNA mismatch repair protein MutL